jgi:hypothetical protein
MYPNSSFDYAFSIVSAVPTIQQEAQTMLWYAELESIIGAHHECRCEYGVRPPDDKSISQSQSKNQSYFMTGGLLLQAHG